jgi:transposase
MANVLSDTKKQQILALGRLGWSLRRIEESTGVRRETASTYLKAAGIGVRRPRARNGPESKPASEVITDFSREICPATGPGEPKPASETITDPGAQAGVIPARPPPRRSRRASACEPYRSIIEEALARGRNATAIWQDLVTQHGYPHRYASVMRFVRKLRGARPLEARVVIQTEPGVEGQVDYGDGPMVRHPETGKYRRTRLFVLTLGCSRKSIRLLTFRSSSRIWAQLHERAFRRLGGAVRVVVLDNLKEGVLKPDIYDPTLNPLYRDVLAHYGAVALVCRVGDPDRKGKVESGVGHAQRTPLCGMRFETLEAAQAYLDEWEQRWADTRIHGTTKQQVAAMFAAEQPHLLPLPLEPFRFYQYGLRRVHLDGCVEVAAAYYAAPPGFIGLEMSVQWDDQRVRLLDPKTGQLLREYARQTRGRYSIRDEDRPVRTPPSTLHLLERANRAGKNIGTVCHEIHLLDGETAVRRILGILSLAKKHGVAAADEACAAALEIGVPTYRFVRRWLERRSPIQLSLRQVDPLIRELTEYRDFISHITQGATP